MVKVQWGMPPEAEAIRRTVFIEEQAFVEEFDALDDLALHLVVYDDDVPVGTARVFSDPDEPEIYRIGRVAVSKRSRKSGAGRRVMALAEALILAQGGQRVELHAQAQAKGFYEKCGYQQQGPGFMEEDCPHVLMVKELVLR
ncbi:MAG: GNAT family N-acetyltransferase [Peptococcus niger]